MSENAIELTSADFDKKTSKGKWVIDFWAPWCGPCKMMGPHFDAAALEMKGKVNFAKLNVDENQDISERFEVMSIPTMVFLNDGDQVNRASGALPKEQIKRLAEESF